MRVDSNDSVRQELADHLTFTVPGARFMPAVQNKYWDGKIRLYNTMTALTYAGLVKAICEFANSRNYEVEIDPQLMPPLPDQHLPIRIPKSTKEPRDYQIEAFTTAIQNSRGIFLCPTASGKSLIAYMIGGYYRAKTLIIVPTISLVFQMKADFESYAGKPLNIHCITAGVDKQSDEMIVISTWQSIFKMPKQWFNQFDVIIGDEVHLFKATSLKSIMEKSDQVKYRFGLTGTLDGSLTNTTTLEGLFGPVKQVVTSSELMDANYIAKLKIKAIVLKYSDQERKDVSKQTYQQEVKFISEHLKRNKFLTNLMISFNQNSLLLFNKIDHGKLLFDMIKTKVADDRDVYLIYGGVDGDEREEIRTVFNTKSNAIIVASYGTFSTGVNIPNLHNVVFGSPSKSRIRVLQSIGRGLRLHDDKDFLNVHDIVDDLKYKTRTNFMLQHFSERANIYNQENFNYKFTSVDI